jgi:hypothetical protein
VILHVRCHDSIMYQKQYFLLTSKRADTGKEYTHARARRARTHTHTHTHTHIHTHFSTTRVPTSKKKNSEASSGVKRLKYTILSLYMPVLVACSRHCSLALGYNMTSLSHLFAWCNVFEDISFAVVRKHLFGVRPVHLLQQVWI